MNFKALYIIAAILFIPMVSAGLFASDIPPTSDGQLWQPIEKFKEFQPYSYGVPDGGKMLFYIVYKNQYNGWKCEEVTVADYYTTNVTEKCGC